MNKLNNREKKENKFPLQRKASVIDPETYRIAPSFTNQNQKPHHFRSQSNFLSSRTSPQSRGDNKQNPSPLSRPQISGDNNGLQQKTQNNLRQILRREFQYQNQSNNQSTNNQANYSNQEKNKIISSLLQDSSINNLKNQMMKIAQNQSTALPKHSSPSMNLLSQICQQKIPSENNKWGQIKKQTENSSSNISLNSTRTQIPNTKDALFKSLLRKNSTILSQLQIPLINQNMSSLIQGPRSMSSIGKEIENKENQQPKNVTALNKQKKTNPLSNNKHMIKNQQNINKQEIINEKSNILNNNKNEQDLSQQHQQQQNLSTDKTMVNSKSQPRQKFPQYFQINLSEYIKQSNKNIESQSTINIKQMINDKSQSSLLPHNIYKQNESSNYESRLSNTQQQYQQIGINSQSHHTQSLNIEQIEQEQGDSDHVYRISTVKDTENSVLHDFRLEKNYIFLN